ncbi:MAG: choice-of-anchor H family protein [Gammaproteobacteria bacterium]|jgi:MYXO-CTERM domain-containing protein
MNTIRKTRSLLSLALAFVALGLALASTVVHAGEVPRESRSAAGFESERGNAERRPADQLEDYQPPAEARLAKPAGPIAAQMNAASCCAYRIYSATTRLFDDIDGDGFYTYLRVNFDIDTDYFDADVFVRLFMRGDDGRWTQFYQSPVFTIYGSSGSDDYEVETELVAGFPPDDYDVLIEVYDAAYGDLVVEYGPLESSALSFLPLEDVSFDGSLPAPVTISRGGGGATGIELLVLALLAAIVAWRRRGQQMAAARIRGQGSSSLPPRG